MFAQTVTLSLPFQFSKQKHFKTKAAVKKTTKKAVQKENAKKALFNFL